MRKKCREIKQSPFPLCRLKMSRVTETQQQQHTSSRTRSYITALVGASRLPDRRHGGETVIAFLSNDEHKAFFFFLLPSPCNNQPEQYCMSESKKTYTETDLLENAHFRRGEKNAFTQSRIFKKLPLEIIGKDVVPMPGLAWS